MSLINIITIAKKMKKPIVYFNNHYLLGTDTNFTTLSKIEISSDIPCDFAAKITDIPLGDKINKIPLDILQSRYKSIDDIYIDYWDCDIYKANILSTFTNVGSIVNNIIPVVYNIDLTDDSIFRTLTSMKASDGHMWYIYDKIIMSCFNSIHPINKTDKIYLSIYDVDRFSVLAEYKIVKKGITVVEYIRYRKL